jgi:hypothetical protein
MPETPYELLEWQGKNRDVNKYVRQNTLNPITFENYLYISHLDEDLRFWKLPGAPETINDTMQSNYNSTSALGRSAPVYTYSNSGPRTVQIDIAFHRDIFEDINMGFSNSKLGYGEDYVENMLNALQSICVPKYNLSNKAVEPPLCAIRICNDIFVKGVVTGSIGLTYEKPILSNGKYARVRLSLTISEVDPYDATTIYKNGGFRGMMNCFKSITNDIGNITESRMGE